MLILRDSVSLMTTYARDTFARKVGIMLAGTEFFPTTFEASMLAVLEALGESGTLF